MRVIRAAAVLSAKQPFRRMINGNSVQGRSLRSLWISVRYDDDKTISINVGYGIPARKHFTVDKVYLHTYTSTW